MGQKKKDRYHNQICLECKKYFHNWNGLNLHKRTSRCGRMTKGKLTQQDKEMIQKYPGKYQVIKK